MEVKACLQDDTQKAHLLGKRLFRHGVMVVVGGYPIGGGFGIMVKEGLEIQSAMCCLCSLCGKNYFSLAKDKNLCRACGKEQTPTKYWRSRGYHRQIYLPNNKRTRFVDKGRLQRDFQPSPCDVYLPRSEPQAKPRTFM